MVEYDSAFAGQFLSRARGTCAGPSRPRAKPRRGTGRDRGPSGRWRSCQRGTCGAPRERGAWKILSHSHEDPQSLLPAVTNGKQVTVTGSTRETMDLLLDILSAGGKPEVAPF
jgi:hypothetical protein